MLKHLLNLALVILLGSCLLKAQNALELPLPNPPKPLPVNETRCDVVAETHVTRQHVVDDGTTPDGIHHTHYVADAQQEISYIRCTVVENDTLVFTTKIPLPQPSTPQERNNAMKRFFDTLLKKGLKGLQKEYGKATPAQSATSKQP